MGYGFKVIIEGDYAMFSRPELKVERVSYDVPTPSALEGILKSIYWKPPIKYVIDKIIVFNPIDFINIRRNEVGNKIVYSNAKKQMKEQNGNPEIYTSECRSQRAAMVLKNVKYGVNFHFELTGIKNENDDESEKKHFNIIKRRLEKGQCFRTPCLGCSEFPVKLIKPVELFDFNLISSCVANSGDIDLGYMLYGLKFEDGGLPLNNDWEHPHFSDKADAVYYRPHMINGIIDVQRYRGELKC